MTVFIGYTLIGLIVAGLLFYGVIALLPEGLGLKPERDRLPFELPSDRRMVRADLDRLRIPVTLRGYRFAETDDLIDRLAAELVVRDEEIARLRALDVKNFSGPASPTGVRPDGAAESQFGVGDSGPAGSADSDLADADLADADSDLADSDAGVDASARSPERGDVAEVPREVDDARQIPRRDR
ncbi:MAG: hypothetical protein QOK10_3722 [Pseudonocardiales bacterium]|nr:hypothetical protein [Pseudonocardiales bacterium]